MLTLLLKATYETLYMVIVSGTIAFVIGLPLGILLHTLKPRGLFHNPILFKSLNAIINLIRSVPYIIVMIAIIPFTRLIVGTSIGTTASIVPLTLCAIPFVARQIEVALNEVNSELIETLQSFGAKPLQIILYGIILEARLGIIQTITITFITLVGYSAMAGAVGGGGLGSLAINYGYSRFETDVMIATIIILVALVQIMQLSSDLIVSNYRKKFG